MLKAVIFDMDGVLIDSMPYHADAWKAVFANVGIKIQRDDVYKIEGSNHIGIIRLVFEKAGRIPEPEDFHKLAEEKKEIFSKINKATVFEGIYELIDILKNKYALAVVSGSDKAVVKDLIGRFFPDTFSVMVTGSDVKEGKPSPVSYLKAVEMLKVRKDECIVIENAPLGVESAKRAGLYCIAIPTYVEPELLKNADIVLPDHAGLKEYISKF
ncbi:MAG: Beta-phosphoglucomutase [Candidatus Methanoperedens nitroreducens]|uniref:Beta-phosphoglucomutase n=1 Tax=Candidatus Methanoperedens nitratireducens TaxID=1392998 RepID=A0A0P8CAM3_9EURY|nr:HAD family phosphatase [Candidatus Methanoperedens sp. BLZ2]KAB2947980.1 MAG: HAD family phosphatase [Candidatus Methanoperedens sp.]KPQ43844.1 MAG: Beta-phosphoglucomutase [Candidatus Methanoperedens sp. BLZ1]MBZ0174101.1 HAD family phosphatase [Candidatus Methanoperedens nitroreducens]MCX9079097.1 HAD family phosphatase [Candidatus Methanoperedens sp.]MCX9088001.1 HAD family phosphatase [Candidatus Methanoperedens sp.]